MASLLRSRVPCASVLYRALRTKPSILSRPISENLNLRYVSQKARPTNGYDEASSESSKSARLLEQAREVLNNTFGLKSFRFEQEAAIERTLKGKNTLVIFPTGAGKSLCYQVPAMLLTPGITIVVCPLIALMKDQVDTLQKLGIPAASLDSTKTPEETQFIQMGLEKGQIRILYCAPERLTPDSFFKSIKKIPGGVRLLAVDEAHCISEWGRSFRPDYLKVARFAKEIEAERVICLTATATPDVAEDICKAFSIEEAGVFRLSPYRQNLNLHVKVVDNSNDKYNQVLDLLKNRQGSSLVYVTARASAESLAKQLRDKGFNANAYHAELESDKKRTVQDWFLSSKDGIVVSTIAFGMGINKPDIRHVIHAGLPASVEQYSQQIGRAGRDGLPSDCILYLDSQDIYIQECWAHGGLPSRLSIRRLLKDIFNDNVLQLQVGQSFKKNAFIQGQMCDVDQSPLGAIYAQLELQFGLIREFKTDHKPSVFRITPGYERIIGLEKSPAAKAIRLFSEKKAKLHYINTKEAAEAMNIPIGDIKKKLIKLDRRGALILKDLGQINEYHIHGSLPETDEQVEGLVDKLYKELKDREGETLRRINELVALFTTKKCISLALAEYAGMGLPDGKVKCGHCSYCLTGKSAIVHPRETLPLNRDYIRPILNACDVRDDPRFLAMFAFGVHSPRMRKLGLHRRRRIFGSLKDHDFEELLDEFSKACDDEPGSEDD